MSVVYYRSKKGLNALLEDHSPEGIAILTSQPSRLIRVLIFVFFGMLIAALIWSFFGRADVIVEAGGIVNAETDQRSIYIPMKGDLVDIYVSEGMPVAKGDVLVRINSPNAIELAGQATQAKVHLAATERGYAMFPAKKKAMEKEIESLRTQLHDQERDRQWRVAESLSKISEEQTLKLEKARGKLAKAANERDQAQRVLEQHERLIKTPGGGGLSREQVEAKRKDFHEKELDYKLAEAELGEFEVGLTQEYDKKKQETEKKSQEMLAAQAQYETLLVRLAQEESQNETELRLARSKAQSAARIGYDDIDEDNYLRIRAPFDGTITNVAFTQVGGQVDEKTPIATIAPKGARKVIEVEINERDRAFLKAGMPVKVKVSAFPHQRYGVLNGELERIAPVAGMDPQTKQIVYKARVGLQRDYFLVNGVQTPVHFGMTATAEIVVKTRRLIDLALDPFRNAAS
jgi:hemolysin D